MCALMKRPRAVFLRNKLQRGHNSSQLRAQSIPFKIFSCVNLKIKNLENANGRQLPGKWVFRDNDEEMVAGKGTGNCVRAYRCKGLGRDAGLVLNGGTVMFNQCVCLRVLAGRGGCVGGWRVWRMWEVDHRGNVAKKNPKVLAAVHGGKLKVARGAAVVHLRSWICPLGPYLPRRSLRFACWPSCEKENNPKKNERIETIQLNMREASLRSWRALHATSLPQNSRYIIRFTN